MPTGGQWRTCETPPQARASVSDCGISRAVDVERLETFSRPPQSASHLQEFSAMDTDMDPPTGSSYTVSDNPGPSNFSLINHQCRLSSNNTIMDLDSGVDPETGERAQG
ncbi:hypothetical protein DPX16_13681 [Anabarilius grahami]|uniref:Uncharacterized protein n=1 Tax=Anabarilius grahami TaxID=495550 RepID=A0A3N0XSJ1_ANAGA|nr:hypothetical protein DPX16_13681 [Anabarilius grahami]